MSGSMFVGRVLLPGLGLALAGILAWQAWRGSNGESRVPFALASLGGSGALEQASPSTAPHREEKRQPDSPSIILAEGHVAAYPGAEVVVGAELPGTITRVLVQEKSTVRKGQLLVEFRGDAIRASAEEAVARVAQADAELSQIEQEQARANRLPEKQQGVAETRERLKARWNTAKARRAEAVAGYRRIEAEFAGTRVRSPIDGVVIARAVNPGETVNLGTPLLRIVDLTPTTYRGRGRCVRHPALRARMPRHDHRPGLHRPVLAGNRRGNRRQPHPPPDPSRRPRPPDRHPRLAGAHRLPAADAAQARPARGGEDRGSHRRQVLPGTHKHKGNRSRTTMKGAAFQPTGRTENEDTMKIEAMRGRKGRRDGLQNP